jgi:hypothetical protein
LTDFQAKICEKFNINSLTDNQSKSITAIIDGKDVFVGKIQQVAVHRNYEKPSNDAKGEDE